MKRSAFISDIIFAFFTASLFTLCIFRLWKIALFPALFLSAVCGTLTAAAIGAYLQNKRKTAFLKKSDEQEKEKLLLHLAFLSDEGKMQFFLERLSTPQQPAKRFGKLRMYTDEAFYFLRFSLAPVSADEILPLARLKTNKEKYLICSRIEESAVQLAQRFKIKILTGEQVYALLKEKNALPEHYLGEEIPEEKRHRRLRMWFARANAKRFLIASALLLFSALLSPFPYYYFVCSLILLLSAIFIRIFGYQ